VSTVTAKDKLGTLHRGGAAEIRFDRSPDGKSYISAQRVGYPFHITRPFYLQGDPPGMPSLYLQSVSGGIYEDDRLDLNVAAGAGALAHVTTQAATIVHQMEDAHAVQQMEITAADDSLLEYMPDPLVLFPYADLVSCVRVVCAPSATVMVSDAYLSHDPQGADRRFSRLRAELRIERPGGSLLSLDRFDISGEQFVGDGAFRAHGSFACVTPHAIRELIKQLHPVLDQAVDCYAGVSELPAGAGLWVRVLARDSHALRVAITSTWAKLRSSMFGSTPQARPK